MITASDSINTIEYDNYFVIVQVLKFGIKKTLESSNAKEGKPCPDGFYYNME